MNITLDSFIVSNTDYKEVSFWTDGVKERFAESHVLFQKDSDYVDVLIRNILEG